MQMTWRPVGERAQLLADRARRLAADARVDLVEDQRRRTGLGRGAHQRQHHPRELAAGGGLPQRARRHARVGRDQELDLVGARRPEAVVARRERCRELRAVHRQRGQPLAHRVGQRPTRPARRALPSVAAALPSWPAAPRARCSVSLDRLLDARQLGVPRPARRGMLEHRGDRAAVLALEPVQQREPLLDLVEATWSRLDALGVAVQLVHEVLGLERQRADARRRARRAPRPRRSRTPARPPPTRAPARRRRRPRSRRPARRRRSPRPTAAPRRGAAARARPPARLSSSSLGSARSISASSHSSRSSSRSRAPARSRSSARRAKSARSWR